MSLISTVVEARRQGVIEFVRTRLETVSVADVEPLLVVVGSACLVVESVILGLVPPASSYETSIYSPYPLALWLSFGVGTTAVVVGFALSAYSGSSRWKQSLLLLVGNYGLFFFLPVFRGYKLYGRGFSDKPAHLGTVERILRTGAIPDGLFYPLEHVFFAELVPLTGLELETVTYVLSFTFTMLYIASMGALVRELSGSRAGLAGGMCAATPLLFRYFHMEIHPAFFSFMLLPLVLLLVERIKATGAKAFLFVLAVLSFGILFFHPLVTGLLLVLVLGSVLYEPVFETRNILRGRKPGYALALAVGVALGYWVVSHTATQSFLVEIARSIVGATGTSPASATAKQAQSARLSVVQLVVRFAQLYGAIFLYLAVAGLITLWAGYRWLVRERREIEFYGAYHFALGIAVSFAFLLVYLIVASPIRAARYAIMTATMLVGLAVHRALGAGRPRKLLAAVLVAVVLSAALLSMAGAFLVNNHLTHTEYQGTEFLATNKVADRPIYDAYTSSKMMGYVTGAGADFSTRVVDLARFESLGYDENETAATTFGSSYVVTKAFDVEFYRSSFYVDAQQESLVIYDREDLERLSTDASADRIYANGRFEVWSVDERDETNATDET